MRKQPKSILMVRTSGLYTEFCWHSTSRDCHDLLIKTAFAPLGEPKWDHCWLRALPWSTDFLAKKHAFLRD